MSDAAAEHPRDPGPGFPQNRAPAPDEEALRTAFQNGYEVGAGRQRSGPRPYPEGPLREAYERGRQRARDDLAAGRIAPGPLVRPKADAGQVRAPARRPRLSWVLLGAAIYYLFQRPARAAAAEAAAAESEPKEAPKS